MRKLQFGVWCLAVVFVFGMALNVSGQNESESETALEEMCVPMGVIVLKPPPSVKQERTSVEFNHSKHFTYDCRTCHHTWKGNAKILNCTASNCHNLLKAPKKATRYLAYTKEGIKYYKYAYHQNCIGCHQKIKVKKIDSEMSYEALEKQEKLLPTSCTDCHPEE
ncbi:MAG: cytochrome c3 family protein [Desulfobacterales bacterium]